MMRTLLSIAIAAVATLGGLSLASRNVEAQAGLPPRLGDYVTRHVKLTAAQHKTMLAAQPVTQLLDADPSREVAVFGAVWIKAPIQRYIDAVRDIERFESGANFLVTKKVSSPPKIEDFAALK